jgi:hypothetical protein
MRLGGFTIAAENCGKVALRGKPRSISDAQQVLPFAKVAPEAHAFRDLECRDFQRSSKFDPLTVVEN